MSEYKGQIAHKRFVVDYELVAMNLLTIHYNGGTRNGLFSIGSKGYRNWVTKYFDHYDHDLSQLPAGFLRENVIDTSDHLVRTIMT